MKQPLLLAIAAASASAFAPSPLQPASSSSPTALRATRRDALQLASSGLGLLALTTASAPSHADVLRAPGRCANGEGDGCAALAEDNALIQSLQRKSSENREANQREALNAYYMKNYPDVFAVSDQRMVKKPDGSFALYSTEEVNRMTQEGRVTIEYPKSKGGRIADLTQKPVLVLKE
ncbi:hypothetical protein ACHAXT_009024 [Thalassiosira profunda]